MAKTKRHELDKTDSTIKELVGFAGRIVKLLDGARAASNKELVGALDDLLGAVYALIAAREEGFFGKKTESEFSATLDRANDVVNCEIFADGNWMAGFHFNNAMFRISAIFDRLPKALAGDHEAAASRFEKKTGTPWKNDDAHDIRDEVNVLKHDAGGTYPKRLADLTTALPAIDELLTLAEALV